MMVEERLDWILSRLRLENRVTVDEEVKSLGVSADTARRDFDRLAGMNKAVRTHGGIILPEHEENLVPLTSLRVRNAENVEQKRRIAEAAVELLGSDDTVVIDAGSTAYQVARLLGDRSCTVLAYSLDIANVALEHERVQLVFAGGIVRRETQCAVGEETVAMISRFRANIALIGANGISVEHGVMTPNHMEASVKRAIMGMADRLVLLADSSKINRRALSRFADLTDFEILITDDGIDAGTADRIREVGVRLIIV